MNELSQDRGINILATLAYNWLLCGIGDLRDVTLQNWGGGDPIDFCQDLDSVRRLESFLPRAGLSDAYAEYEQNLRRVCAKDDQDQWWRPHRTIESAWWCASAKQRTVAILQTLGV